MMSIIMACSHHDGIEGGMAVCGFHLISSFICILTGLITCTTHIGSNKPNGENKPKYQNT